MSLWIYVNPRACGLLMWKLFRAVESSERMFERQMWLRLPWKRLVPFYASTLSLVSLTENPAQSSRYENVVSGIIVFNIRCLLYHCRKLIIVFKKQWGVRYAKVKIKFGFSPYWLETRTKAWFIDGHIVSCTSLETTEAYSWQPH